MALVLLKRFDSSIDAELARSFLASEGIMSFLFDGQSQWNAAPPVSIPVRLMVAEEDLEGAGRVLRDMGTKSGESGRGAPS